MSSLKSSYNKITNQVNQGVFSNEESLLRQGRVYQMTEVDIPFGDSAVVEFTLTTGVDIATSIGLSFQATSEEFQVEFFAEPTVTDATGTDIPLIQQHVGKTRLPLSSALLNPTITDDGTPGSEFIIRGIAGTGNRSGLSEGAKDFLSSLDPGLTILLRVTNKGAVGVLDFFGRLAEEAI